MPRVQPPSTTDTLERLRAELERERAVRLEVEQRLAAQTEWIATVSHEMRSTLTAILVWSGVIANEETLSTRTAAGIDSISTSARRQLRLAEDMLDHAAARVGRLSVRRESIDLRVVVARAIESVRPSAFSRDLSLDAIGTADAAPMTGDADRLEQVLVNLLWNAMNHTPPRGRVLVELSTTRSHHRVRVIDTGVGIAAATLARLFDPYRPTHETTGRDSRGAGLGLVVAKHIVEAHGGGIAIESDGEDRGTTVTVVLPR